jgi:hypothetical protein
VRERVHRLSLLLLGCCVQIATSVAAHLSTHTDHATLAQQTLPVSQLYEEAMEKQIHANKVSWYEEAATERD